MKMNLATDPWIPVVLQNGQPGMVSLTETFQRGANIQDLAVRPHERIALMRLLICVAQAALDGPKDHQDWQTCRPRIAPDAADYLKRWRDAFELFGDKQRFLQVQNLKPAGKADEDEDGGNSVSKLDLALATGNNSTLFDNAGGSARDFTSAQLALMLLTFQCFSPLIGRGYLGRSPCVEGNMLHTVLRGRHLIETVHLNLVSKETVSLWLGEQRWGKPVWEAMPASPSDQERANNAQLTYLGRLVPVPRALRLGEDCTSTLLGNLLKYPKFREAMATVVVRQQERRLLAARTDKGIWRELGSLTVKGIGANSNGGPIALQNMSDELVLDLWVGGLVTDYKAKVTDAIESVFHIPANMLTDIGQRLYEDGVGHAQELANRLGRAVVAYRKELGDDLTRRETRDQANKLKNKAAAQYWTDIEREVQRLLEVVADSASLTGRNGWPQTVWGKSVWRAVLRAFDFACPYGTPRQMQAFVLARQALFRSKQPDISKDKAQEIEA